MTNLSHNKKILIKKVPHKNNYKYVQNLKNDVKE